MFSQIFRTATNASVIIENPRLFHTCSLLLRKKTHYEVLQITPKATAQDIKESYYRLSKLYHPDRNKDNPDAVEKFREISESYEVLGNFNLRKLYDKGILHTASPQYAQQAARETPPEEEEDPTTRFYRMREKRTVTPTTPGETVYDFDEWTKQHYGRNFDRKMKQKAAYDRQMAKKQDRIEQDQMTKFFVGLFFMMAVVAVFIPMTFDEPYVNMDNDKKK
ncbi:dnaJ homolog subfamily C member 30, mitochondrial [Culicoides brevitarsis]|uniref:dnaJ homolog subfamily C member 30, mitochondrial n=1 Tax=Culicoides brevitarsis TaxID=469753 RepID=UPI00307B4A5C